LLIIINHIGKTDKYSGETMADVVTEFMLKTCRVHQLLREGAFYGLQCCCIVATKHPQNDMGVSMIPLSTGSSAEFYIEPMLPCIGDVDVMIYFGNTLAIPRGHPPPTQLPDEFHDYVHVFEIINSHLPGYVYLELGYLLTECEDGALYGVICYDKGQFSRNCAKIIDNKDSMHGPADFIPGTKNAWSVDAVYCVRCLVWPSQAADWPTRHRNYDWPDSATVDRVVSNGCDVVGVAHRQCKQHEWMSKHQWRLSFSRAEIVLINSWMPVQQIVYHMLRVFVKTERLTESADNSGVSTLSNYHIKTLMLWTCELKPRIWWTDDLSLVRICVELLHTLDVWLTRAKFPHYFVHSCNLRSSDSFNAAMFSSRIRSTNEASFSKWFVNSYIQRCSRMCPSSISRLFNDVSTSEKLQKAVSAVVDWRINSTNELCESLSVCRSRQYHITESVSNYPLTVQSCVHWLTDLRKIDQRLLQYFTAVAFLHISRRIASSCFSDKLRDILAIISGQQIGTRRSCNRNTSVLYLSKAAELMKVAAAENEPTTSIHHILTELSKAYLYRALSCKDSDSDSIYCLANVYLAVLYYTTGQYQTAIDRCTLVMRSQDHSQCTSHIVQGELMSSIGNDVDIALGLAVFYQYVRTAAFNQQHRQHTAVFSTELFAWYLLRRCLSLSVKERLHIKQISANEIQEYRKYVIYSQQILLADALLAKIENSHSEQFLKHSTSLHGYREPIVNATELNTDELVELLQTSAVEHLTTFRQMEARDFGSVATIVTTDFDAMYAYKHGYYQQCLQLSTQNVHTLLHGNYIGGLSTFPEFIQLLDDDIASLIALTLIVNPRCRNTNIIISQLTLSLYLMTQCQLKLRHSMTSLAQTLHYIEVVQRRSDPVCEVLNHLVLKLAKRKAIMYIKEAKKVREGSQ